MGRQSSYDRINSIWNRRERVERIQEFLYQDGHVSFCLHDLRKDSDRIKSYVRGLPLEEFDGFLIKMQAMDDTITDLTPPTSDRIVKQYDKTFHHCPITPQEHKLTVTSV